MSSSLVTREKYTLECERGHSIRLSPTDLERHLREGEDACSTCNAQLSVADDLVLECHICLMTSEVSETTEARYLLEDTCGHCRRMGWEGESIHVPGSWNHWRAQYMWKVNGKAERVLKRAGREDYWEALVHFCDPEEFASIYGDRRIVASPTGRFTLPAVCLTDTPSGAWAEIQRAHGSCGFVFQKRDVIRAGGGPVAYLSRTVIDALKSAGESVAPLKPFVNLLQIPSANPGRPKVDFLHEREWRLPRDLIFNEIEPYAVIVGAFDARTRGWESIWRAMIEFEELDGVFRAASAQASRTQRASFLS